LSLNVSTAPIEELRNFSFHFAHEEQSSDDEARVSFTPYAQAAAFAEMRRVRWRVVNVTVECFETDTINYQIVEGVFSFVPQLGADVNTRTVRWLQACGPPDGPLPPRIDFYLKWESFHNPIVAQGLLVDENWSAANPTPIKFSPFMRDTEFTLFLNSTDDLSEGGCNVRLAFVGEPELRIATYGGYSQSSVVVTHQFPVTRKVSFSCLTHEQRIANLSISIEHFAPIHLRFAIPCEKAPHFSAKDADYAAHRFYKEYLSQPQLHGYADSVSVRQLRDIKDVKLGRDDDWDDWALLTFLNTTPPSYVRNALPSFWGGLHIFYEVGEVCEPDFIICWDHSQAKRRGPPCVYDACPPNAHTNMWLWVAFGALLICVAVWALLIYIVRDYLAEKHAKAERRQRRQVERELELQQQQERRQQPTQPTVE
jgi:hypothetical protein